MSRAFRNIQGHFIVFLITLCLLAVCNMQTVYADENTEAVSINIPESIEINKYTVYTLDPEILPLSADQHFNVESSNPNVVQADISGIGETANLLGVSEGHATVTVSTNNGLTASAEVTVLPVNEPTYISLNEEYTLKEYDHSYIYPNVDCNTLYKITVDDNSVVSTFGGGSGLLYKDNYYMQSVGLIAQSPGTTTFTIETINGLSCSATVTVNEAENPTSITIPDQCELKEGDVWDVPITLAPEGVFSVYSIWADDGSIVTTATTGVGDGCRIFAKEAGKTNVTIMTRNQLSAVCEVTVSHDWDDSYTVDIEPTCAKGLESIHCRYCGQTKEAREIDPIKEHKWNEEYTVDKEASCTEEGSKSKHCSVCGVIDETTVTVIPKADHTYGDWKVTKEATCAEDGSKEKVCSVCEDKVTEVIPATGHKWNKEYTVDKEATCTEEGSKSLHCSKCSEVTEVTAISAFGHEWDSGSITTEPTCTEAGVKTFTCNRCKETKTEAVEAKGHTFSEEFTVDLEPSCTEEGSKSKHCLNCDEVTEVTSIHANGHTFGDWIEITASTCENPGLKQRICEVCKTVESEDLDPNGHDFEKDFTVDREATCTEDGSQSKHCKNCDAVSDSQVIPAAGHTYGDWSTIKEASCDATGLKEKSCSVCGVTVTEDSPALGHAWNEEPTVEKEATCTETGSQSVHCARCNETRDAETIPSLGHDWSTTPTVDKNATCTEDGKESTHCTRCDVVQEGSEKAIPATGHKFSSWKTTKAANEIAAGQQTRKCSVCGKTEIKSIAQLKPTLPAVKIATPKAAKKSATVKWNKVSKANQKKIASIQIQYSLDKTFKTGVKTVTAKKTATSKKITKLASKKTYYVRIRAYKKSGNGVHVSKWSTVKKVKAK